MKMTWEDWAVLLFTIFTGSFALMMAVYSAINYFAN
jgi:hypothetical protein